MTPYDFVRIAGEPNLELALDGVFQEAHAKWTDENIEADGNDEQWTDERTLACLTQGQITVLVVETYFGEVLNGGHYQYFSNESGGFANFAPAALRRVNLDELQPLSSLRNVRKCSIKSQIPTTTSYLTGWKHSSTNCIPVASTITGRNCLRTFWPMKISLCLNSDCRYFCGSRRTRGEFPMSSKNRQLKLRNPARPLGANTAIA
jgi:hypothetical protein